MRDGRKWLWLVLLVPLLFLAGCRGEQAEITKGRYALRLYDESFHYTREIEALYDESGALKSLAIAFTYDSGSIQLSGKNSLGEYPDAEASITVLEDGSMRLSNVITARSVEAGALEDEAFRPARSLYENLKTESDAKIFWDRQLTLVAEKKIPSNENNSIIINGEAVSW